MSNESYKECYSYNSKNEYVGQSLAWAERLPVNATFVVPDLQENYISIFNEDSQVWNNVESYIGKQGYVNGVFTTINEHGPLPDGWSDTAPEPSIVELKESKKQEISNKRDSLEQGGLLYDGSIFDSDQTSYMRLLGASSTASKMVAEGLGNSFFVSWTLQDNTQKDMTANDMVNIVDAFTVQAGIIHTKATALKQQVEAFSTIEEIQAFDVEQEFVFSL